MENNIQSRSTPPGKNKPNKNRRQNDRRRFANQGPAGQVGRPIRTIIGVKGLKYIGGRIREEYLNALKGWNTEVKLYLEMRDDPIVATLLDAVKIPLMAANFDVEPATGGGPNDEAAAEWLWEVMHSMDDQTWVSHVEDALECLDFGFSVGEIIIDKRADGRLWLHNIDTRGQETLDHWDYNKETEKPEVFAQLDPNMGKLLEVPLAKCVHFRYRGRKGNPQGKSLLRPVYRAYKFARNLEDLEGIGIERDIGGMPIAEMTEGGDYTTADVDILKSTLKGLRMDEEMFLISPPGIKIAPYSSGNKVYDVAAVIDRYQKIILGRFFAQFLKLGMADVGTQALVQGSQDFFTLGLESVQRYLLETWNLQMVPYLFKFNSWSGISDYPKIVWEQPGKVDLNGLITYLNTAIGAKLFTPTDADEDHIRSIADMPELAEDERGFPRDAEKPPMSNLFDLPDKVDRLEDKLIQKELAGVG